MSQHLPGLQFLELTFSIDGVGRTILVEVAKGREPPLHLLRGNYEQYVEGCSRFRTVAVDWESYQNRFLELTGVHGADSIERRKQAWTVLFQPSKEQLAAVTELRGRRTWVQRIHDWLGG